MAVEDFPPCPVRLESICLGQREAAAPAGGVTEEKMSGRDNRIR